jgi:O-acetyl-ADP-ribose deacetylase (regulator of RNase III)
MGALMKFEVVIANIANQPDIEAVVNSANANLRFGSGVAGAIHSAAGPELEDYCEPYAPLPFGAALVTPAFKLPNKYVIHTRADHYLNDDDPEGVLTKCVYSVVDAANKYAITSIAVPAIGTGVFKFPNELAAGIMAKAFLACAAAPSSLQLVRLCVADADTERVFKTAFFGV